MLTVCSLSWSWPVVCCLASPCGPCTFCLSAVFQDIRNFVELSETNVFDGFVSPAHWPTYTGSFTVTVKLHAQILFNCCFTVFHRKCCIMFASSYHHNIVPSNTVILYTVHPIRGRQRRRCACGTLHTIVHTPSSVLIPEIVFGAQWILPASHFHFPETNLLQQTYTVTTQ